jgi:hypothetical protein
LFQFNLFNSEDVIAQQEQHLEPSLYLAWAQAMEALPEQRARSIHQQLQ